MNARIPEALALIVGLSLLATGCVSGPSIDVQRAPGLDVSSARTYGWVEQLGTDRAGYESMITTRLKRAVGNALEAKGLTFDPSSPDVLVNFYVNLEAKQEVVTTPGPGVGMGMADPFAVGGGLGVYHGYRMGLYDPWPDYVVETREYQVGTLTVDLVDADSNRLAWEAVAAGRVTRETATAPDEKLGEAVNAMFARFP